MEPMIPSLCGVHMGHRPLHVGVVFLPHVEELLPFVLADGKAQVLELFETFRMAPGLESLPEPSTSSSGRDSRTGST